MYNALACFICARSIVLCQTFGQIMQRLPGNWIGEGNGFHGPLGRALPLPSRVSLLRPLLPGACYTS